MTGSARQCAASCKKTSKEADLSENRGIGPLKPKRPLTAYNLFFHVERKRILEGTDHLHLPITPEYLRMAISKHEVKPKRIHQKTHGLIGFRELTRAVALRWKSIDQETKNLFENQARLEKHKYAEQLQNWLNWCSLNEAKTLNQQKTTNEPEDGVSFQEESSVCSDEDQRIRRNERDLVGHQTSEPNMQELEVLQNFVKHNTSEVSRSPHDSMFDDSFSFDDPISLTSPVEVLRCPRVSSRIDVEIDMTSISGIILEIASSPIFKIAYADGFDLFEPMASNEMDNLFMNED